MNRNKALSSLTLVLFWCLFSTFVACQEKQRRSCRYLVPEGFVGWVKVYYKVEGAPALPLEDGRYLFKFPASGVLKTSSDIEYGWAQDQYFSYSEEVRQPLANTGWGEGGMIWADYNGSSATLPMGTSSSDEAAKKVTTFYGGFFVGTEAEYTDYGRFVDGKEGAIDKQAIERIKRDRVPPQQ